MKALLSISFACLFLLTGAPVMAEGINHEDHKPKKKKKERVYVTHTVELRRVAFQKMEEHCDGIKMCGNYIRVKYQTFFSDGSSKIWEKEYRS